MTRHVSGSRPTPAAAVACAGLTKDYGSGHGVFDLDLTVRRGETFGFVGPNGAGKTTTIRLLMDLIRPNRGTATLLDLDSRRDSVAVKRRVGYLPGELVAFPGVTAGYVVGLLAGLRGDVDPARITALAERFDLDLGRRYETLSHGNKQKVGLIQAFMHRPDLVILDEPTLGLDPVMQREFRRLVQETVADGATVFLSSHVLSEVEQVCDRIGLIRSGRLRRVGSLNELRALRIHRIEAVFTGRLTTAELARVPGVAEPRIEEHLLTCSVRGNVAPLLEVLSAAEVIELDSHEMSLEEVFLGELDQAASPAGAGTGRRPAEPAVGR
jgi:ABC-2 type transport system ATP-binding protein